MAYNSGKSTFVPNSGEYLINGNTEVNGNTLIKKNLVVEQNANVDQVLTTNTLIVTDQTILNSNTIINGKLIVNGVTEQFLGTADQRLEEIWAIDLDTINLTVNIAEINDATVTTLDVTTSATISDATITTLAANTANIATANVDTAVIDQLDSVKIISDVVETTEANVITARITDATVDNLDVENANVTTARITELLGITGEFENIVVQDLTVTGDFDIDVYSFFDTPVENMIYVKKNGDDSRSGLNLTNAVRTVAKGLEIARLLRKQTSSTIAVNVYAGIYVEDGDLEIPENCALISTGGQYVTELHMSQEGREQFRNMLLVNSGSYVQGFGFRNQEVNSFDDPSGGFAVGFKPGARIIRSPYIRDCSQVSNVAGVSITAPLDPANANPLVGKGGGMIIADRKILDVNSIFPYILAFGATPRSPNGIGYCAKNGAGINGIGSLGIFQRVCFYGLNGGQVTLNNSGTQFGDISMQASGSMTVVEADVADENLLVANIEAGNIVFTSNIIDDMWDDLVANGPEPDGSPNGTGSTSWSSGFIYDEAKCQRDVGYIIDAVINDISLGTNYNSITAGQAYRRGNSSEVIVGQFTQTISAIEFVRNEIKELAIDDATKNLVDLRFENIIEIFYGSGSDEIFYDTPGNSTTAEVSANRTLDVNRVLIQDHIIEYIANNYPFLQYNETLCRRDMGYIIDGLRHDILYGGNYASRIVADAYFEGTASLLGSNDEVTATIAAYQELQTVVSDVILGTYVGQDITSGVGTNTEATAASNLLQITIDCLVDGNTISLGAGEVNALVSPDTSWVTQPIATDVITIDSATATIQSDVITFINEKYQSFTYDQVKCRRDVGYIVDAITWDYALDTNYNSITAGLAYIRGNSAYVLSDQFEQTILALEFLGKSINTLDISGDAKFILRTKLNIILEIIKQSPAPEVEYKNPVGFSRTKNYAKNHLLKNKSFIQDEIITWINSTYPTLIYDTTLCRRDLGFIIDGLIHDLVYGGNFASRIVADSYYEGATLNLGAGELGPTRAALAQLQVVVSQVVQAQYAEQDTTYKPATQADADILVDLIEITRAVLLSGTGELVTTYPLVTPDITWTTDKVQDDYAIVVGDKTALQDSVILYINTTYGDYYEYKAKRDAANFILALSLDLKGGSQMVSKSFALGFFNINAVLAFPVEQKAGYYHTWRYMEDRLVTLLGAGSDEAIMISALVDLMIGTTDNPTTIEFGSLVESLAHQFNNAGAGVNRNALPLNFRSPGFNRTVPFTVIQEGGGRVRWSGADELNNQYFAGGTKINGITGKFEGRPFNISVRQIARRLANSRGAF